MAKKTTPKQTKRLDPKQSFVVQSMTREDIANTINDILSGGIDDHPSLEGVKEFTADDPRLTDEVCQRFADGTNDAICEEDGVVDREYEIHTDIVVDVFGS